MAEAVVSGWSQPAPPLAMEIYERIIDRIDPNPFPILPTDNDLERATLAACSLTCRAWTPRSRMHVFENITLKDSNHRAFVSLVRRNPIIGYQTRHCHIKITTCNPRYYNETSAPPCSITSLMLICLKWLPALQALTIQFPLDGSFLDREHHMLPQVLKRLPIKYLRLRADPGSSPTEDRDASLCNTGKLVDLISYFPYLINLELTDWYINHMALDKGFLPRFLKTRVRLTALHMRCTLDSCVFIDDSLQTGTLDGENLQELHLILVSEGTGVGLNIWIFRTVRKLVQPSLRELSLEFTYRKNVTILPGGEWPSCKFGPVSMVKMLYSFIHVAVSNMFPVGLQRLHITCATTSIASIGAALNHNPRLREITFSYLWYPYDVRWENHRRDLQQFAMLDFTLVNPDAFPSLETFTFQEKKWDSKSKMAVESGRKPSDLMPYLYETGILRCHTQVIPRPNLFPEYFP